MFLHVYIYIYLHVLGGGPMYTGLPSHATPSSRAWWAYRRARPCATLVYIRCAAAEVLSCTCKCTSSIIFIGEVHDPALPQLISGGLQVLSCTCRFTSIVIIVRLTHNVAPHDTQARKLGDSIAIAFVKHVILYAARSAR